MTTKKKVLTIDGLEEICRRFESLEKYKSCSLKLGFNTWNTPCGVTYNWDELPEAMEDLVCIINDVIGGTNVEDKY